MESLANSLRIAIRPQLAGFWLVWLLAACSSQLPIAQAGPDKQISKPYSEWQLAPHKKEVLFTAIRRYLEFPEASPAITKRFYWQPVVVDAAGNGLYDLSNLSHLAPIYVINSENAISTFTIGDNAVATQDSVRLALSKHGGSISRSVRNAIAIKMKELQ